MTFSDVHHTVWLGLLALACTSGHSSSGATSNVVPISVDGCGGLGYLDEPCVSATVCVPNTSECVQVSNLLLDTGSVGLRVFSQVLPLQLPAVTAGSLPLAECATYLDGSADWGPVVEATVVLGGEPGVTIPIQLIDASYAGSSACSGTLDTDPSQAGFNGILGVQNFLQDCGAGCSTEANNGLYFTCSTAGTCTDAAVSLSQQVANPVGALTNGDGNGLVVSLNSVPSSGATSVSGELILGIGTHSNNTPPSSVIALPVYDSGSNAGEFWTTLESATMQGFVDTGSSGLFFPAPSTAGLTLCSTTGPTAGFYCPGDPNPDAVSLSATNSGATGTASAGANFQVVDIDAIANDIAAASVGGPASGPSGQNASPAYFDWGLPFYFGRSVYFGFEQNSSTLGAGPLVGYSPP